MSKKSTNRYIDNKKLREEFIRYKQFCEEWEKSGKPKPAPLKDFPYIGEAIFKIANNYVTRRDWSRSVVERDELISQIVHDMVLYCHNVNPCRDETGNSIFNYLTAIASTSARRAYNKKMNHDKVVSKAYDQEMISAALKMVADGYPIGDIDTVVRNMRFEDSDVEEDY